MQELWYRSAEVQRCGGCEDVLGRCRGSAVKGDSAGDCAGVEVVQECRGGAEFRGGAECKGGAGVVVQ